MAPLSSPSQLPAYPMKGKRGQHRVTKNSLPNLYFILNISVGTKPCLHSDEYSIWLYCTTLIGYIEVHSQWWFLRFRLYHIGYYEFTHTVVWLRTLIRPLALPLLGTYVHIGLDQLITNNSKWGKRSRVWSICWKTVKYQYRNKNKYNKIHRIDGTRNRRIDKWRI